MYKLILSVIFTLSSTFLGCWFSQKLSSRRQTLEAVSEAISKTQTLITFSSMEILRVVLDAFSKIKSFKDIENYCSKGNSFVESFNMCVDYVPSECGLTEDDKSLLRNFAQGLGVSDLSGQVSNCELYKKLFEERINEAKEKEKSFSRLYKILGFSLGCIVTLMIV